MNAKSNSEPMYSSPEQIALLRRVRGEAVTPPGGWLQAGRQARALPQRLLAEKLGIKRQAWAQLETSEAREAISLYSLRRAAAALDFDLVYFLVPRAEAPVVVAASAPRVVADETAAPVAAAADAPRVAADETAASAESARWADTELPTELR
jgi:transcriptional regulator with XRE-family HTH domain